MKLFERADILLPRGVRLADWSVIACDQYTSEPEYWERVERRVGDKPSALRLVLPEVYLERADVEERITRMEETMARYLAQGLFAEFPHSYLLTERIQRDGRARYGVIGNVDLEAYDYRAGSCSPVRATEGTVLSRIPPRVRVRKDAPLELPHIMLLLDDPERRAIEMLVELRHGFRPIYDFELMEGGGHLRGWLVPPDEAEVFSGTLELLYREECARAADEGRAPLFLAVGDGNHSLATAKECYEAHGGARYAMCELCNLHSPALDFEPIHRVLFDIDREQLLRELLPLCGEGEQRFCLLFGEERRELAFRAPDTGLVVGTLQNFIDRYLEAHGGRCDYIHGEEVVERLSGEPGCAGFLLPGMSKEELFPAVRKNGALPRKTFSMGHAWDKRFYTEAQRIKRG